MKSTPVIGARGEMRQLVREADVIRLGTGVEGRGPGGVAVFSTPAMIMLMELAARQALAPFLDEGEEQVGTTVEVSHTGPAPLGGDVRAVATITDVQDRAVTFSIEAFFGENSIGKCTHKRAVVLLEKLRKRMPAPMSKNAESPTPQMKTGSDLPQFSMLRVQQEGTLLRVALNRPDKRNAIHRAMALELAALREWLTGQSGNVSVVIISGQGNHFCAGNDLKELAGLTPDDALELDTLRALNCTGLEKLPQVTIASIQGSCIGGGFMVAACCDFRFASMDASFALPEVSHGWPPAYGNVQVLNLMGKANLLDLALTGRTINARTALEMGFLNKVVPGSQLQPEVDAFAKALLAKPAPALQETKRLIQAHANTPWPDPHIADLTAFRRCLDTPDAREGIQSFMERRPPRFPSKG